MAEERKDYYKILEITDDEKKLKGEEFNKVVAKHFKRLAVRWHPDRCKDNKEEAEEKFKEINEAKSVLSDEKKRAEYDNPQSSFQGFSGDFHSGFGGMDDIFNEFFGGSHGRQQQAQVKGSSKRITLSLTLEEMYNGVKKKIKYDRYEPCDHCHGSGMTSNSRKRTCKTCGGSGFVFSQASFLNIRQTCPTCGGKGSYIENPCPHCKGMGVAEKTHELELNIGKGVMDGNTLIYQNEGNYPPNGQGINGDLHVIIKEKEGSQYERQGDDLYFNINVPVVSAILGCNATIKTINGKTLTAKIPQGVNDGYQMRFKGYGMPHYGTNSYGNMFGVVNIKMPKNLTEEERETLKKLKTHENFKA